MRQLVPVLVLAATSLALGGADGCPAEEETTHCTLKLPYCGFGVMFEGAFEDGTVFEGTTDGEPFACSVATRSCDRQDVEFDLWNGEARLWIWAEPEVVELSIRQGETVRFAERFTPAYETSEPNGPGCGFCTSASERRVVPYPAR